MSKSPIYILRIIGLIEGVSFLLLLGIAMPLKYVADFPTPVKIAGWAHGLLFILFSLALLVTFLMARWSVARSALIFAAALIPFGPFLVDRRLQNYDLSYRERKHRK